LQRGPKKERYVGKVEGGGSRVPACPGQWEQARWQAGERGQWQAGGRQVAAGGGQAAGSRWKGRQVWWQAWNRR